MAQIKYYRIANWERWQGRTDLKSMPWLKLSSSFHLDPKINELCPLGQLTFIICLCEAARQNDSGRFGFDVDSLATRLRLRYKSRCTPIWTKILNLGVIIEDSRISCTDFTAKSKKESKKENKKAKTVRNISGQFQSNEEGLVDPKLIGECIQEWKLSLARWSLGRAPELDAPALARLIQRYGADRVKTALRGFRSERKSDNYDPAQHCNIARLLDAEKFTKLETLGSLIKPEGQERKLVEVPDAAFPE